MCRRWRILAAVALAAFLAGRALAVAPQEAFEQIYGDRVRTMNSSAQRVELAKQLVKDAAELSGDRPFQAFVYNKAYELASSSPDGYATAAAAMESLESAQPSQKTACEERILDMLDRQSRSGPIAARRAAADKYFDHLSEAAAAADQSGDADKALALYEKALARTDVLSATRRAEISEQVRQIRARQTAEKRAAALKAALDKSPGDAKSAFELIRILLIDLDRPAEAVQYTSGLSDPAIKAIVADAAKDVASLPAPEALRLGDWYRQQAGAKPPRAAMAHAVACYKQFLNQHPGEDADHLRARLAMQDLSHRLDALGHPRGQAVNLLRLIDPQRDTIAGAWKLGTDGLDGTGAGNIRLRIPYQPPQEYDFRIEFTRTAGTADVVQVLTEMGAAFSWQIGSDNNSTCRIGDAIATAIVRKDTGWLTNNRRYTSIVQVRGDSITALLDGQPIFKLVTDFKGLNPGAYSVDDPNCLGLGSWNGSVTFHVIEVVELSGPGKRLVRQP